MFKWLLRKRLSDEARRKLLIAAARSEEAIIHTHVVNALELLEELGDEVELDRGIELYVEMMGLNETLSATVTNRVLARLESSGPRGVVVRGRRFENVFRDEQRGRGDRRRR
jgi:16S rRNA C1402 (ribose-2'-O) methylase RsmI